MLGRTTMALRSSTEGLIDQKLFNGEFDPGSELTLAACLSHASRTGARGQLLALVADG